MLLASAAAIVCGVDWVQAVAEDLRVVPGEYIITVPARASRSTVGAASGSPNFASSVVDVAGVINREALVVRAQSGGMMRAAAADADGSMPYRVENDLCKKILAEGRAESCSPNFVVKASAVPNDPQFSQLWGLSEATGINAPRAWDLFTGSNSIVVAVIDTGIDYNHPDLAANMWRNPGETAGNGIDDDGNGYIDDLHGINARTGVANPGNPMDDHYHGTHVAGTIGAVGNNGVGVVGVNQRVKMMALKFLSATGSGSLSDAIRAIDYATMMRNDYGVNVRLSNNSWGGGGYSAALENAIKRAKNAGIIFVAAAGNSSADTDSEANYPSGYDLDNVVSVAALDSSQNLATFSNYGATTVDIAAPGVDIRSTMPTSQYGKLSGTSMATPHVAGALALLLGREPGLSYLEAIDRLYLSGANRASLVDGSSGVPLVRTQRTLNLARMLYNETAPLPTPPADQMPCGYDFQPANLLVGGEVDTSADEAPIVNQTDEGSFYQVDLPFSFPFFRESVNRIWLSPNGVVYTRVPTGLDYVVSAKAPKNSIAALQADLIPRAVDQGVRVAVGENKVTVMWRSEHYGLPGQGLITVRLTIRADGTFSSSAHFGPDGLNSALKSQILGDPFSATPTDSRSLVGATGALSTFFSVLDLAAAQSALTSSSGDPLALGVGMATNCDGAPPPQDGDPEPVVTNVLISKTGPGRLSVPAQVIFYGTGSGSIPVTLRVNTRTCRGAASVNLSNGAARIRMRVPAGVRNLTATASGVSDTYRFRWSSGAGAGASDSSRCARLLRSISPF
jgi:subtilisin family serine protease